VRPWSGKRARDRLPVHQSRRSKACKPSSRSNFSTARIRPRLPLLDQVEERHAGLRVVRCRHHRRDCTRSPALGRSSPRPSPASSAPQRGVQKPPVADIADVELEGILGRGRRLLDVVLVDSAVSCA